MMNRSEATRLLANGASDLSVAPLRSEPVIPTGRSLRAKAAGSGPEEYGELRLKGYLGPIRVPAQWPARPSTFLSYPLGTVGQRWNANRLLLWPERSGRPCWPG